MGKVTEQVSTVVQRSTGTYGSKSKYEQISAARRFRTNPTTYREYSRTINCRAKNDK